MRLPRIKRPHRAAAGAAVVGALIVAMFATVTVTNASWRDEEWDYAAFSTIDCASPAAHETRGAGKLLSGDLLSVDLDGIVALDGVTATNDGTSSSVAPASSSTLGSDTYANPLSVSALGAINVDLGGALVLPLGADVGLLNQYANASADGTSAGASGVVNDSGAIDLSAIPPGPGMPTFATLELGQVLDSVMGTGLGGGIANLADVRVDVGAVASSTELDGCAADWSGDVYSALDRDYYIAGLRTELESALIGDLVTTGDTALNGLETTVEALAGDAGLLSSLSSAIGVVVGGVATGVGLGTISTTLMLDLDLTDARELLVGTIQDSDGIVTLDLGTGVAIIDTAALFDSVEGLNNQAPNTQLLLNDTVINALSAAVASALSDWVDNVVAAIDAALAAVHVTLMTNIGVKVPVVGTDLGSISLGVDASLEALENGSAPVTAVFTPAGIVCTLLPSACALVGALVTAIVNDLPGPLGDAIYGTLQPAIDSVATPIVTGLLSDLQALSASIVTMLGSSLDFLFGESGVLSLVVNAQNAPDPAEDAGHPLPGWAGGLDAPTVTPYSTGQYDVSAIRLVAVGVLAGGLALDFGRSSAGSNGPA
ncbi:choice-of-anchor G family protein [Demequina aurantiaca]|uniref:choice-of-anchor G family protein n=1 Tax=Demequina aurantiaca TaxID=676200 RepID=UPI003D32AAD7